jgi:invasion protein IalB
MNMNMTIRRLIAKISVLGVVSLSTMVLGSMLALGGNETKAAPKAESKATTAPAASHRVETINYDGWVVTCSDTIGISSGKTCSAELRVLGPDSNQILLNWQIGLDKDSHLVTVVQVPIGITVKKDNKVSGGILLKNGVELKFGNNAVQRLNYVACNAKFCEAVTPVDEAFFKEAAAATTASITIYAADGTAIPLSLDVKGIDKAITAVKR